MLEGGEMFGLRLLAALVLLVPLLFFRLTLPRERALPLRSAPRIFAGFLCGLCLVTLVWIGWGLSTPGDYFANGNRLVEPTLIGAFLVGICIGFWLASRIRTVIQVAVAAALCFWVLVPNGWWSHGLPRIIKI